MIDFIDNWTREHFKLYLFIYAAQANHLESDEEIDLIHSRFKKEDINKVYNEVKKLNDYYRCQIIINYLQNNSYHQSELDDLLIEIKGIFTSDGKFDMVEKQSLYMLEKLLKA